MICSRGSHVQHSNKQHQGLSSFMQSRSGCAQHPAIAHVISSGDYLIPQEQPTKLVCHAPALATLHGIDPTAAVVRYINSSRRWDDDYFPAEPAAMTCVTQSITHIVCTPHVVHQVEVHSLTHVWCMPALRQHCGVPRANQGCIQCPDLQHLIT